MERNRVLILCTGNSARSQIAEGLLRTLGGSSFEVASAGTHPAGHVHPLAVEAMRKRGIDISTHKSKSLELFRDKEFDVVITVCDEANQECPVFPGKAERLHWSTPDPSFVTGTEEERLAAFLQTVQSLEKRIRAFIEERRMKGQIS